MQIEQAIAVLETHRAILGDRVADTTIVTLQEKLVSLRNGYAASPNHRTAQRKQITTLFARLTGLEGVMTESRHDTGLLDLLNVLWRRLDETITEQGGMIDKHISDGVMGLFGVPLAGEDDPERAIRAALAMRAVLIDFFSETSLPEGPTSEAWRHSANGGQPHPFRELGLRIGINTGPVLLGKVGTGNEYTVIGSAVNIASRLEHSAPAGGILISHDTYLLVRGVFNVESMGPVEIKGRSDPMPVYLVLGMNPRTFYPSARGVEGIQTQMVGRASEMLRLKNALHTAASTRVGQVITIVGEAGVGKSRLIHEFTSWTRTLPESAVVFKGRTDQRMSQLPYSLVRDLLATHCGIQDTDQTTVVEDKLARGMRQYMDQGDIDVHSRAQAIGQLIGLSVSTSLQRPTAMTETPQLRDRVFNYIVDFFEAVAAKFPVALVILEDTHWADERSLELILHLAQLCERSPLLLICLTRPQPARHRPPGDEDSPTTGNPLLELSNHEIELASLSQVESRLLVKSILRKVKELPRELCDLIVTKAEGNPFCVEELIKVLIEDGVIVTGPEQWQVQQNRFQNVRIPPTLTGALQARLDRLSTLERTTLQRAAVVGRVFWDSIVVYMGEMADRPVPASETTAALRALEKRELIFRRKSSGFAGTSAYLFKHALLRDVTYESVLLRKRPFYHKLVADWLAEQSGDRISEYAGVIAEHYEQAGQRVTAAELYETAAVRAQEMYNPDVATGYYRRSLGLLAEEPSHTAWQLSLAGPLGQLLLLQLRLVEAAQAYMTMRYIAQSDGDLAAQAHAWNGLARIYREQGEYVKALECAGLAEQLAWLVSADEELVTALLIEGEAHHRLGDSESAIVASERALDLSNRANMAMESASSTSLLCSIHLESGRLSQVHHYLAVLEEQISSLQAEGGSQRSVAFCKSSLGKLYNKLRWYSRAAFSLLGALEIYREIDDQGEIASVLNALGETARLRRTPSAALPLYRESLSIAEAIGDQISQLSYRTNLGGALVNLGRCEGALEELSLVVQLSKDVSKTVSWRGLPKTYRFMAEAYLCQGDTVNALAMAKRAHFSAQRGYEPMMLSSIWNVLGRVVVALSPEEGAIVIDGIPCDPDHCFAESQRILRRIFGNGNHASLETVQAIPLTLARV